MTAVAPDPRPLARRRMRSSGPAPPSQRLSVGQGGLPAPASPKPPPERAARQDNTSSSTTTPGLVPGPVRAYLSSVTAMAVTAEAAPCRTRAGTVAGSTGTASARR